MTWVDHVIHLLEVAWDQRYIIMGLDCDSMLCAAILKVRYPNARLLALYDFEYIVQLQEMPKEVFKEELKKALWVDQDMLNGHLSIGQHLTTNECADNLATRNPHSFNPNEFFKQKYQHSFRKNYNMAKLDEKTDCQQSSVKAKCPFSTAMLLLHVLDNYWQRSANLDALLTHADSVGYNMLVYPTNCEAWRRVLFGSGSQINDLICEMQQVYCRSWMPNCDRNHDCRKMNDCFCAQCANICSLRMKQRSILYRQFTLMSELADIMQNYFDDDSRKTVDTKFGVEKNDDDDDDTPFATNEKRPRGCTGEFVHKLSKRLGGSQGLKLRFGNNTKFGKDFNSAVFLSELDKFYRKIYILLTGKEPPLQFAVLEEHFIAKAKVENFGMHNGKACVRLRGSDKWIPLNEFMMDRHILSFAILSQETIRFTQNANITDDPKNLYYAHITQ